MTIGEKKCIFAVNVDVTCLGINKDGYEFRCVSKYLDTMWQSPTHSKRFMLFYKEGEWKFTNIDPYEFRKYMSILLSPQKMEDLAKL